MFPSMHPRWKPGTGTLYRVGERVPTVVRIVLTRMNLRACLIYSWAVPHIRSLATNMFRR